VNASQRQFLDRATAEAVKAGHVFPRMAACEAALESSYGHSQLAVDGNNLFGCKQHLHPNPEYATMTLPTREFEGGEWKVVPGAQWVKYPDWRASFADRMVTLERLSSVLPHYKAALAARDERSYVISVSESWSTDPGWQCRCGQQFGTVIAARAHEMGHGATYGACDVIPGLGRALKVISVFDDYTALPGVAK
jgi:flagellum-specific peptidoglycan hydrolase FlgJ